MTQAKNEKRHSMKPSEVIRETRNVLFERGWHQGSLRGPGDSRCVIGATYAVIGIELPTNNETLNDTRDWMETLPVLEAATAPFRVSAWNDEEGRTFSEVIDMLDKAEKIAEQRETLA